MLWILLITIVLFVLFFTYNMKHKEPFDLGSEWHLRWIGPRSKDCYTETSKDCLKYMNCGLCHKFGKARCIPGDVHGPLFTENCDFWQHTDFYDNKIFGQKVETTLAPWSRAYSDYETWYPSPTSQRTLMY